MKDREIELKLKLIDPQRYSEILEDAAFFQRQDAGQPVVTDYETIYYDTTDCRLMQHGLAYRIRKSGERFTATVKDSGSSHGGLHIRGEWNKDIADNIPDVAFFSDLPIGEVLQGIVGTDSLVPVLATVFQRTAIDWIGDDGSVIELAADIGQILSGDHQEAICEIELELKSGAVASVLRLGAALAERYPLAIEERSKFLRGLMLAGIRVPESPSYPLELKKKNALQPQLQQIFSFCLHEIMIAQTQYLATPDDPEVIHQFRIKLRQFRSLLSFFRPLLGQEEYDTVQAQLKQLGNQLSYIRELDVLAADWNQLVHTCPDILGKAAALTKVLTAERDKERAAIYEQAVQGTATATLLNIWAWVLEREWVQLPDEDLLVGDYVCQRFQKRLTAVVKGMKKIDGCDYTAIHALRIQAKKLRYVAHILAPVMQKEHKKALAYARRLQSQLGKICDAQRHIVILRDVSTKYSSRSLLYEGGIMIGFQLCLLKQAAKDLEKFE